MFYLRVFVTLGAVIMTTSTSTAEEDSVALPPIWMHIREEASRIEQKGKQDLWWEAAERIAMGKDRMTIDVLFRTMGEVERLPIGFRNPMKTLAMCVSVQIADPQGRCGLRNSLRLFGYPIARQTAPIIAMACYDDGDAREWLLEVALMSDKTYIEFGEFEIPGHSYLALQLLRGYQHDTAMRERLERSMESESRSTEQPNRTIPYAQAVRSVLSSWDYGATLTDLEDQERYRSFQSRMWRFYAMGPSTRTRRLRMPPEVSAEQLLEEWQTGDERFVVHIFENSASTPDEAKIAVYLAHKLPESAVPRLQAIGESDSPQAPYAREALQWIERQSQR